MSVKQLQYIISVIINGKQQIISSASLATNLTLEDLNDVIITNPISGDVLTWDGSDWINQSPSIAGNTTQKAIIAHAGGGQGSAYALTKKFSRIDTCATDHDSTILPAAILNSLYSVNNVTGQIVDIYPQIGENFLTLATNAPFSMYGGNNSQFVCYETGVWTPE